MVHQPYRGDDVEVWIRRERDKYKDFRYYDICANASYFALDNLLDDYRLHADTGVPLLSEEPMQ